MNNSERWTPVEYPPFFPPFFLLYIFNFHFRVNKLNHFYSHCVSPSGDTRGPIRCAYYPYIFEFEYGRTTMLPREKEKGESEVTVKMI